MAQHWMVRRQPEGGYEVSWDHDVRWTDTDLDGVHYFLLTQGARSYWMEDDDGFLTHEYL